MNGKEYIGQISVCENDMPQVGVPYPGYAQLQFIGEEAIIKTYYPYISYDTITTVYNYQLDALEPKVCAIRFYDKVTGADKGLCAGYTISLVIPAVNCGLGDGFYGNYTY